MAVLKKIIALNNFVTRKDFSVLVPKQIFRARNFQQRLDSTSLGMDSYDMNKEREDFLNILPAVINTELNRSKYRELTEINDRLKMVLNENLSGGKCLRGLMMVMTYKYLETPDKITEEKLRIARSLGWCVELLQAYLVVLDDIMDSSPTRRGKPSWHLREDVGLNLAINDSIFIFSFLAEVLKNIVGKFPNYGNFIDIFNETLLYTCIGQYLDIVTSERNKDYKLFTMDRYNAIVKYKSSYYTYRLPVTLGLLLANKMNENTCRYVHDNSMDLGRLFQMQDDYIDCFGDKMLTGKVGRDIEEGKCSWLAVKALERCNNKQRTVFFACYGSAEPAHVERVKQLYVELQLPHCYREEENKLYNNILETIRSLNSDAERKLFSKLLDNTYKRNN